MSGLGSGGNIKLLLSAAQAEGKKSAAGGWA
jgi:hypothetical protein